MNIPEFDDNDTEDKLADQIYLDFIERIDGAVSVKTAFEIAYAIFIEVCSSGMKPGMDSDVFVDELIPDLRKRLKKAYEENIG